MHSRSKGDKMEEGEGEVQSEMVLSCLLLDTEGEEKMDPVLL